VRLCTFWEGELGHPRLTQYVAGVETYLRAKFNLDPSNRLATIHQRHRQTGQTGRTDRQRSDSIVRTVLQTVAQKPQARTSRIFLCTLAVAVARSSCDDDIILRMTSCLPIIGEARTIRQYCRILKVAHQRAAPRAKCDVYDCLVTFCVSRRRRKMYCGHARLCVCPRPDAHTTAWTRM